MTPPRLTPSPLSQVERHNATDFGDLWLKTRGPQRTWVISASVAANTFLGCLCYSMICGDLYASMAASAGVVKGSGSLASGSLLAPLLDRRVALLAATGCAIGPLCFLDSLAALSPFSLVGVGAILFSTAAMGWRFLDGTYRPGGRFFELLQGAAQPSFGKVRARALKLTPCGRCELGVCGQNPNCLPVDLEPKGARQLEAGSHGVRHPQLP
jgi:hypothetical protein